MKTSKGFKVTDENMRCQGFQFELGKEFRHEGEIELCSSGFHFCKKLVKCFDYYDFNPKNRVFEIEHGEAIGDEDDKMVTDVIVFIKELTWSEVLDKVNMGVGNSGYSNSGDKNSGNWNSGNWNSGDWNSGYYNTGYRNSGSNNSGDGNSGYWNSGYYNTGYRNSGSNNSGSSNSGDRNSGDWNSGYYNTGYRNSGDRNSGSNNSGDRNSGVRNSGNWNSGDSNSGFLNSTTPKLKIFNKETDVLLREITFPDWLFFRLVEWRDYDSMTEAEKILYPDAKTIGGYLKVLDYKEAAQLSYAKASKEDQDAIELLPNYDADILYEIFGIDRRK